MNPRPKWLTLERWAESRFPENAPHIGTLRRWARDGKIQPAPKKHGRSYYVPETAEYVGNLNSLVHRAFPHAAA